MTFAGSLIAFAKLNGNMSGASILLPGRHLLNIAIGVILLGLIVLLVVSGGSIKLAFWGIFVLALILGVTLIIPIGGFDMPVVVLDAEQLLGLGGCGPRLPRWRTPP